MEKIEQMQMISTNNNNIQAMQDEADEIDFSCFICFEVMVEPKKLLCCNHHVCTPCVNMLKKQVGGKKKEECKGPQPQQTANQCPMCRQDLRIS